MQLRIFVFGRQCLKRALFSHVSPLIARGRRRPLEVEDIPPLPKHFDPREGFRLFDGLSTLNMKGKSTDKVPLRATLAFIFDILKRVRKPALIMSLLSLAGVICDLLAPVMIHELLDLVARAEPTTAFFVHGTIIALGLGLVSALGGIFGQNYIYKMLSIGQTINAGLNHAIYKTALRLSRRARQDIPTGDVVNLMGSDSDAVQDVVFALDELLMILLSILGAAGLMTLYLGKSGFAAVVVLVFLVPPTKWIAKKFCVHNDAVAEQRDLRVAYMTQVLTSVRIVKSFVWESLVTKKVAAIRAKELKHRYKFIHAAGLSVVLYRSIGMIIGGVVLGVMVYLGEALTAAKLFTAMALIAVMEGPFGHLTDVISMLASCRVSAERIGKFLASDLMDKQTEEPNLASEPVGLRFSKASFRFEESETAVLQELDLKVDPGTSVAVVGPVGSGKSSLIAAILGEIRSEHGSLSFYDCKDHASFDPKIAYVPQEPFILNASLRNNILFGVNEPKAEEAILKQALHVACLDVDVRKIAGGLAAEIGEHGVNLSGGQKQRVALARAVIQNPSLLLLDDPLSALDDKTEDKIMDRLLFGEWRETTKVVVTHRLKHLHRFDQVVFLEGGKILAKGKFAEVLENCQRFADFYSEYEIAAESGENLSPDAGLADVKYSTTPTHPATTETQTLDAALLRITENEDRQYGAVHRPHYAQYLKSMWSSGGTSSTFSVIAIFALAMTATTLAPIVLNSWMGAWGDVLEHGKTSTGTQGSSWTAMLANWVSDDAHTNILIYVALASLGSFVAWSQYILYGRGGVCAGQNLHNRMLSSVLGARVRFYDATPIGRILNRFARDLDTVERNLPWSFEQTIRFTFQVLGSLILVTAILPMTIWVTVPILFWYYRLQKDYRISSREAQRLYSVTRSPRFSHFKETLAGLPVIRAFDRERHFKMLFLEHTERNMQMFHGMVLLNRWFSLRVSLNAAAISIAVSLAAVYSAGHGLILAGTAGLVITYGMKFWEMLNWAVRSFSQLESQMTSVERVERFSQIPQEQDQAVIQRYDEARLFADSRQQAQKGMSISFQNVQMRYADHLPMILRGMSFDVAAGQRVGIVGRTGAGKSSIFHTLFRFSEMQGGDIKLGEMSIKHLSLETLRGLISVVPQDPTLFMGTFRSNCDPFEQFTDLEIWDALSRVQMDDAVRVLPGGLNAVIAENGLNLSQGERQLICLARALLSAAPIILMDEATSGIDVETDARIQKTIRREFVGRTILIIAHRLATIADCDLIVELQDGIVAKTTEKSKEQKTVWPKTKSVFAPALAVGDVGCMDERSPSRHCTCRCL